MSAAVFAVPDLVGWFGDRGGDAASTQVGAVGTGAVGLVGPDPDRPLAGPAGAEPRDADLVRDGPELRGVATLPGGDDQRPHVPALLTRQADLGGQPATEASQRVIGRLADDATRRLALLISLSVGAGGVLMCPGNR
jgi:hypothetical protein